MSPLVPPGWPPGYEHWPKDRPIVHVLRLEPGPSGPTVWVSISTDRWGEDYSLNGVYATAALALAAVDDIPLTIVRITEELLQTATSGGGQGSPTAPHRGVTDDRDDA